MTEKIDPRLHGVSETLLMPLYIRAKEALRPDALLLDAKATGIMERLDFDFSKIRMHSHDEVLVLIRARQFDRFAREFLERHPDGVVVHIGCGLDTRFERVDNGRAEWYDLDVPAVIKLRQGVIEESCPRHHLLGMSVFEDGWMLEIGPQKPRPFLFMAEGVFQYFEEAQIRSLVLKLRDRFPGAELVFDSVTPFLLRLDNLHLVVYGFEARLHFGLKHARDLEEWGPGICLLQDWYYFDSPEPRLGWSQGILRLMGKSTGIFRYRLG